MKGTASSSRQGDLGGGPGGVRRKVMVAKVGGCHDDERKGFMMMYSYNYGDSRGQAGSLVLQHCAPSPQETGAQKT